MEEGENPATEDLPGLLSKPRPWINRTVWVVLGLFLVGLVWMIWRHLQG